MLSNRMQATTPEQHQEHLIAPRSSGPWTFNLNYERPPRGLHKNDSGTHWAVKAGAVRDIRTEVMVRTRALHTGCLERIRVDVVWVVKTHHVRDTDGPYPFLVAIYDGIASNKGISARIVDDDSPECVDKPALTVRYEKGCTPHFEVTITDIGGEA